MTSATDADQAPQTVVPIEIRVLEGPNLYFTRPAIKIQLALPGYLALPDDAFASVCRAAGLRRVQIPAAGSAGRQRVTGRIVEQVVRALAAGVGVTRVGVRARGGNVRDEVIAAAVWRHRGRAEAVAHAVAPTLRSLLDGHPLDEAVAPHLDSIRNASKGEPARLLTPRIPVAAITGTNGKTTTTRLLAHLSMTAGFRTAWSSTDGIVVQGEVVEAGDYSGPAGSRGVLEAPGVEVGILETARGGMLLRGLGVTHNDVSVVTNVSADHLGMQGIDTVDQLAEVKAIITKVTKRRGWCVLNGEDPRVWAMHSSARARPWVFTIDPDSPAIREALNASGRAITILDDHVTVLGMSAAPDRLLPVVDLPMTLSGLSRHNVANALAGAAAGLALGLPRDAVIEGLRTFQPDDQLNPGRMNVYSVPLPDDDTGRAASVSVILDLAHNEAGLEALLEVARGLTAPGAKVRLALGTAGDRSDEILEALGEIAGRGAEQVVAAHKQRYLRGRTTEEMEELYRIGLTRAGVADLPSEPTELDGMLRLLRESHDGDVVAVMTHADREQLADAIRAHGGRADDARAIRRKVVRARGQHEHEADFTALWEMDDPAARIEAAGELVAALPGDARALYEHAGTFDSAGQEEQAVPLYEAALTAGLEEPLRHRCQIQLASSLRNLGRAAEGLTLLDEVVDAHPESLGARSFRALMLHDLGRSEEAVADLLSMIARTSVDADVERYRRALTAYAAALNP